MPDFFDAFSTYRGNDTNISSIIDKNMKYEVRACNFYPASLKMILRCITK